MKINKSLDIDLNIISPQRNIQIHEGDIDSIDIVLAVSADDVPLDLTGLTIKYDATINNYLAEQDANGSVDDNKIVIPVTENMAAMPGLLLIDVRMIQEDEILFTRTIRATVERAVVNGSTYIDFSKITIVQRMNALEEQMTYIEELVDGLDTSKQITSNRRPPQTAPATVDVDFFRVGDTWIYQGVNIVYKLVEVEYNYQPDPLIPAVHKFTWQPLNEHFNFGTTEPPTSATYTPIEYVIGELSFSALPVPEYFKGDTYAQLVSGEIQALSVLTNAAEVSSGQYTFTWHENGSGDADNKMDLAPINPTAQAIEDMPSGQLYGDTVNHKGIVKNGQEFYDAVYIDENFKKTYISNVLPPGDLDDKSAFEKLNIGDRWRYVGEQSSGTYYNTRVYTLVNKRRIAEHLYPIWKCDTNDLYYGLLLPVLVSEDHRVNYGGELGTGSSINKYDMGSLFMTTFGLKRLFICNGYTADGDYNWSEIPFSSHLDELLPKKENISNKVTTLSTDSTDNQYPSAKCVYDLIGDIGSAIDTLNGNIDTLNTNLAEV